MVQCRVIIVGATPAESLCLEEALNQAGCLENFRSVALEQAMDRVPDWDEYNLLIARYYEQTGPALLSLLAPVLRTQSPPVMFLIDPYDPAAVARLLNAGGKRILPVVDLEQALELNLSAVIEAETVKTVHPFGNPENGKALEVIPSDRMEKFLLPDEGFIRLFRYSPIGISINRLRDGVCADCNESFARLIEWPREALIGRDSPELGISSDVKQLFEELEQRSQAQGHLNPQFERKIYTRSRQIRHIHVHLDLIEWAGEECILSLVQDITEKEQVKEKIKRLNDELERLVLVRTGALEAANRELAAEIARRKVLEDLSNKLTQVIWETPDVVAISAPDGTLQFLNKAGRMLFQLREEEPVDHLDIFSMYPAELRSWIRDEIQPQVMHDGIWRGEAQFQLPDGRAIPLSQVLLCKKDEDGQVLFFASIARDVSDFKGVEQELRHSRERYRTLAEAAHDFIFMVSKDGLMEYANEYACHALGFDPARVEGIPASQFFPQDFAANHLQMFSEVHEIDRPIYTEGPFIREGNESWLGTWLVPIHTENGGLVSILGISRDITEQKKTDEALQRALQNERKLGEMRSNFFSMTSHQFRTPLSTILLSAELLQKYGRNWDVESWSEQLSRIQEAAFRMNSMLEDILVIGRVESGRYICTPKEFDFIPFMQQLVREIGLNDRGEHKLVLEHEVEQLPVYLDPDIMQRVIDNLLSNAIKYSPQGTTIKTVVRSEDRFLLIEVTDHGIGIPERDLKYLFQPFQRGSNASDYPGTGIGLTIIQKSVELLNGIVSLKSKEGQGTTFIVRIPVRLENAPDRIAA
jgi:PAS domain S-box-containing protein